MQSKTTRLISGSLLLAAALWASPAFAENGVNLVRGVSVEETADATVIRVAGDEHPTYSVYQLRNPLRLFVDIANSDLVAESTQVRVDNGVVSQVATVEYVDAVAQVTRVVVGFEHDATYDVVSDGTDLVITIDGAGRRPSVATNDAAADIERLERSLADSNARLSALSSALRDAEGRAQSAEASAIRSQIEREQAEQARLEALASNSDLARERDAFRSEVERREAALAERERNLASLSAEIDRLQRDGSDAQALAARLAERESQLASIASEEARLRQLQGESEAERATLVAERERLRSEQERMQQEQQRLHAELSQTRDALAERESEARAAAADIEALRSRWSGAGGEALPAASVRDVRFEQDGETARIIVDVTGDVAFESEPWQGGRATLVLAGASLPDHLRRTLDTQAFDGSVAFVSSYVDAEGRVRVVADTDGAASEILRQEEGRLVWEFTGTQEPWNVASALPTASPEPRAADGVTSYGDAWTPGGQGSTVRRPRMARKRITIDLRNADIQNVLRLIADEGNINIVASDDVTGTVTLRLRSVPLDEALAIILQSKGLGWQQQGNIIRVAPQTVFEEEYERELQRMADSFGLEPLQVRLISVNYAQASVISSLVQGVLSSRGSVAVDQRNNLLVVTDIYSRLETAEQLVGQLDSQTPQILIEARIVETNDQFRRQLGIQWGGDFVADQSLGNATGLLFPSTIGIAGGAADAQTPVAGTAAQPNFAVNLPAAVGTGQGGAIGFTFGNLSGSFNLNLRLSAAESQGSVKVISAPRIMTLDNQQAQISSGVSIPVSVVSAAGAQTVFFDASLTLQVTPRVTPDGNIFLDVNVNKNEPDFENTGARGDPSIIRREARTQLLVRDGDTTVIGGIFQRNTGFSTDRVPFFGSLPLIGPLFRNSSRTDVRNELLVFITPRIVNRDLSIERIGGADLMAPTAD